MLQFACPKCRKTLEATESQVGWQILCPGCGQALRIAAGASRPQPRLAPAATAAAPSQQSHAVQAPSQTSSKKPTFAAEKREWYIGAGSKEWGPYSSTQLRQFADDGRLRAKDSCWKKGMRKWVPAGEIGWLARSFDQVAWGEENQAASASLPATDDPNKKNAPKAGCIGMIISAVLAQFFLRLFRRSPWLAIGSLFQVVCLVGVLAGSIMSLVQAATYPPSRRSFLSLVALWLALAGAICRIVMVVIVAVSFVGSDPLDFTQTSAEIEFWLGGLIVAALICCVVGLVLGILAAIKQPGSMDLAIAAMWTNGLLVIEIVGGYIFGVIAFANMFPQ